MTTFDLNNKKTSEIIVKDRILSSDYEKDLINKMIKSIKEIGLTNPIQITENNELIDGLVRLKAMEKLNLDIPCIIIKNKDDDTLKLIEIDTNLIRRQLSKWQTALLIKAKKDIYEKLHPTSTKSFKSINNIKDKEDREETEKSFSKVASEEFNCSEKTITNISKNVDKIKEKNPKTIDLLSYYDNASKFKLKGTEIDYIADLSIEEINALNSTLEEKNSNGEKFKISEILTNDNKKYSKNKQLNMILEYEINSFKNDISNYKEEEIELIKSFIKTHNVDFKDTISKSFKS